MRLATQMLTTGYNLFLYLTGVCAHVLTTGACMTQKSQWHCILLKVNHIQNSPQPHYTFEHTYFLPPPDFCSACSFSGIWLKAEETVSMKIKRADFAAAFLRGRMVVAGGLGKSCT